MDSRIDRRLLPRTLCLLGLAMVIVGISGCANPGRPRSWNPFGEKETDYGIKSPKQRMAEMRQLAKQGRNADPASRESVAAQLALSIRDEGDPLIRAEIVRTLAAYPCQTADSVRHAALDDAEVEVREVACEAWGNRGDATAVAALSRVLGGDVNGDVRLAAARALGNCKGQQAVAALGDVLSDKSPAMQRRAVLSLKEVTGENFGNDVNRWQEYVRGERPEQVSVADRMLQPVRRW